MRVNTTEEFDEVIYRKDAYLMYRFRTQHNKKPAPPSVASDRLPLEVIRIRALHHIHDAAEILSDAMPEVPEIDRQLYASIVSGLCTLERHLTELNKS
ncbi:MAG: hypothetical protein JO066_03985 [Verrucomicrobia bacterium]|nr:hypothetical protein [Verrucomicrobiota bacterium]MBV9298112.1 hypothetical protein [Verrucomicrobiota bacterium]